MRLIRIIAADDSEHFYNFNKIRIDNLKDNFLGVVITFFDQTDKVKAEQLRTSFLR
jgi:hypothetical protein